MPLTLADQPLILPRSDLIQWIERSIPTEDFCPWGVRAWPGPDLARVAFPSTVAMPRRLRLSSLWWPAVGASKWAYGHFLADGESVAKIRAAANGGDGSGSTPITLRMASSEDENAEVVEADLTLLRVIPLSQVPAGEGMSPCNLYMLLVVDARYFWQSAPAPDFGIKVADAGVTWQNCFDMLATALGVTISVDSIDPAYLYPDVSLNAPGESAAVLLDALAANVGKRVVRKLGGSVQVMGFDTSQQVRQGDDQGHPGRRLRAGGDWFRETL